MRPLTLDQSNPDGRPYFLWDGDVSAAQLTAVLRQCHDGDERLRLMGKLLREARDLDVWRFVTPSEVAEALPARLLPPPAHH